MIIDAILVVADEHICAVELIYVLLRTDGSIEHNMPFSTCQDALERALATLEGPGSLAFKDTELDTCSGHQTIFIYTASGSQLQHEPRA
jgi:hypothetical protein